MESFCSVREKNHRVCALGKHLMTDLLSKQAQNLQRGDEPGQKFLSIGEAKMDDFDVLQLSIKMLAESDFSCHMYCMERCLIRLKHRLVFITSVNVCQRKNPPSHLNTGAKKSHFDVLD